ncbi:tata-box-binding protein [Plasmopara halstedii]|uniref:Tata-box-binding protein n=1 Tax=Plasmopara halstedii TaxID=4781 RepID=A0A0P1AWL7_PLAHL|nr:tata-box-binding protein [Plasmopara halstedii]CEG45948.1 tata-box-binding protein [Plasmopara halstedii]|eukprot:XP_024582317.1 tata-box-binding protein [Plasmopara halstedii]
MSFSSDEETWSHARLAEEGVAYRVVNVLGSGFVNDCVDIKKLALLVRNADYAPRGFNALVMRFQSPRATILLYRSGKSLKASFPSKCNRFSIRNVVGSADVCFKVRLEGLARDHLRFSTYEPELFPGLIYRMLHPKCTLLIFISGKIVITGCESPAEGEKALCTIYPVLLQYRLRDDGSEDEEDDSLSLISIIAFN